MRLQRFESLSLLSLVAMALAFPNVAAADVVGIDEFAVVNNGTQIFDDSFNRTLTLSGGSGTIMSSGTTFANSTAANYFVKGTITETTPNNGQAKLNTAEGTLVTLPDPFVPKTLNVQAFLETGSNLTAAHTFSDIGLFDLAVPGTIQGTYLVGLSSNLTGVPGRELEMRVRETNTGPVLQFAWLDFANNKFTLIDQTPITAADLADPQLELQLSLGTAGSNVITASYAFGSGNTLASFNGSLSALGSTDSSTDVFTSTTDFVHPGFAAFAPNVPEPSTWAMMLIGFAGLGFLARRRRTRAATAA